MIVIGATSYIGSNLCSYCKQKNISTVGTGRKQDDSELYYFELGKDKIESILDLATLGKKETHAVICAAISSIDYCYSNQDYSRLVNVTATCELVSTLNKYGISCIFLSSESVFDGETGYYSEQDHINPITIYGKQKAIAEDYILQNDSNNLVVRISRAVGDKNSVNRYNNDLLSSFLKNATKRETIRCIRNQSFTPTYVIDIAKAIVLCMERKLKGIYHISNNEMYTRAELARIFCDYYNFDCDITELDPQEIGCKDVRQIQAGLNGEKFILETGMSFVKVREILQVGY